MAALLSQREIDFLLNPFVARAKNFKAVMESELMTSFILLLVLLGITYDIIVVLVLGMGFQTMEKLMFVVMWIYVAEIVAKLGAHIAALRTLRE